MFKSFGENVINRFVGGRKRLKDKKGRCASYCGTLDKSLHISDQILLCLLGAHPANRILDHFAGFGFSQAIVNLKNVKVTAVSPVGARDSDMFCLSHPWGPQVQVMYKKYPLNLCGASSGQRLYLNTEKV